MSSFIDEVSLYAKAGDGGNGCVAWRREAHVPKGGPAGGDGGDGGDVVLVADPGVHSLLDFKYEPRLMARNGQMGRGKNQGGEFGSEAVAKVPVGTQVFDEDTGELIVDMKEPHQRAVICEGGSGGFGNSRFATPSRQAPEFAKPGLAGEEKRLRLSLKLMADVGLLGFPNAGKSTFLSRVSAAKPKIAAYPFTTLVPQLGVVRPYGESHADTFVLADIPGLIEGASDGAGLGIKFLKHLERVRVLCHLVEVPIEATLGFDVDDESMSKTRGPADLVARYTALRRELAAFSKELAKVPEVVVINKTDVLPEAPKHPQTKKLVAHLTKKKIPVLFMSGATGDGIAQVTRALAERVRKARAEAEAAPETKPVPPRSTTTKAATTKATTTKAATTKAATTKKVSTKSGSTKSASTTKAGSKQASRKQASTKRVGSKRTGKTRVTRTSRAR